MDGIISNIQRLSLHDGPGVRSTVFFKGCPLRCAWCHNPETYTFGRELRYNKAKCIGCRSCISACENARSAQACENSRNFSACKQEGARALTSGETGLRYDKSACRFCFACAGACPGGALAIAGMSLGVDGVLAEVMEDFTMYRRTGGGVTLSGGEPAAQPDFCCELLDALAAREVHTCVDTCGFCKTETLLRIARKADMTLYDVKHIDSAEHKKLTGAGNELILDNLRALDGEGIEIEVRIPVIPGVNDGGPNMSGIARLLSGLRSVRSAVLLGYHKLGQSKIYNFDMNGPDPGAVVPKKAEMERLAAAMREISGKPVSFR